MRAAIFYEHGGPEVIRVEDVADPEPGPSEVRIRVGASSLNHLDLWARRGLPGVPMPHIGGSDIAGTIDSLGAQVVSVAVGDRIVVDPSLHFGATEIRAADQSDLPRFAVIGEHTQGGHAEFAVVPEANLLGVPDHVSFEVAAAAGLAYVTAWRGLITRGGVCAGDRVLITGASGGVATAAVQIALELGARVFAVTSGTGNVERLNEMGADVVYDRLTEDWPTLLHRDTGKSGVDCVFDSIGESTWSACVRALAFGGRLVTYGATTGPVGKQDIRRVFWKQLSILGTTMGGPDEFRTVMERVFEGSLEPIVADVIDLDRVGRAHERLEAGDVFGKLVVKPRG